MQVASCLAHHRVSGHRLTECIEKHHQFIDVHVSVDGPLTVYGHDGNADEEVERGCFVVRPAGLPDV